MTAGWKWILTAGQQRAIDEDAVRRGTPSEVLMRSAGRNAAGWILSEKHPASAVVLAGPGGNGGDAFVVAEMLHQAGVDVHVFSWRPPTACAPLTAKMAEACRDCGIRIDILEEDPSSLSSALARTACVVDGLFGSGLARPLSAKAHALVDVVQRGEAFVASLDVPSGISSDGGALIGPAIRADVTLAMAFYKPCHWLYPAASFCGDIQVMDVDYPPDAMTGASPMARVPTQATAASWLPLRRPDGHKGTFGHVVAVVGSQGMTGAAILCARGALRAGAGRITLALPATIAPVVQEAVPEALTMPLPDRDGRLAAPDLPTELKRMIARADALAIGPGLSRTAGTQEVVRELLRSSDVPCVVDADGLYALIGEASLCASLAGRGVLTPHPGEFAALVGSDATVVDDRRMSEASAFASRPGPVLVLKGRPTIVASAEDGLVVNPTGNTGLSTGGSGDVLTGMIAAFMAMGRSPRTAAMLGSYLHGVTAARWAAERSERSMTPTDILDLLPYVLKELET